MAIVREEATGELSATLEDVLSWGPCDEYSRDRLRALAGGRQRVTAREILDLPIPAEDRLWAVLREELIPASILHEFACRCAEAALHRERAAGREPDQRSWKAIEVKRAWLRGEASDQELDTAWSAARSAWSAAESAARSAAARSAWLAARSAALDGQIVLLREILEPIPA